jgi:hypothetical protein
MENNIAQKITAFATILALPFALGAFVLAWAPAQQFHLTDPRGVSILLKLKVTIRFKMILEILFLNVYILMMMHLR